LTVVQNCSGIGMMIGRNWLEVLIPSRMQVSRGNALSAFKFNPRNKVGTENFDGYLKCRSERFSDETNRLSILSVEKDTNDESLKEENRLLIQESDENVEISLNFDLIKKQTACDKFLSKIKRIIETGWASRTKPREIEKLFELKEKLKIEKGCVLYENRTVIPKSFQDKVLKLLHFEHNGIMGMKMLARKYVFWNGLSRDIENFVKNCKKCQDRQKDNGKI
jgi:hypothetical protein